MTTKMSDYQRYIAASRYARYLPEKKRRETWEETVTRYCDFWKERFGSVFPYDDIKTAIHDLNVMPSMRALMTAGKALDRDEMSGFNCSYVAIDDPRAFDEALYVLMCGVGLGFSVERQVISKLPIVSEDFHETDTVIKVKDSKIGWAAAYRELIAMLFSGQVPKWDLSLLRPAGAPLKTFGGRSSGPDPLNDLFKHTVRILKGASGRKLTSVECHDIMCHIANTVVVGGVRRSALISGSNLSDDRMRHAKTGQWWVDQSQRALANNSVIYTEKPEIGIFMEEWMSLYNSKSGERGVFNRQSAISKMKRFGRRDWKKYEEQHGFANPCCFTGDMKLLTDTGYQTFSSLNGKTFNIVNSNGNVTEGSVWSSGVKPVVVVKSRGGYEVACTSDHIFMLNNGEECAAEDLAGKRLMPFYEIKRKPLNETDFKAGFILGDGNLGRLNSVSHKGLEVNIGVKDVELIQYFGNPDGRTVYSNEARQIAIDYMLKPSSTFDRELPPIEISDDFMMGVYSANGSVISSAKRVSLKTTSRILVDQVQTWLTSRGIASYVTTNKPTDVRHHNGTFTSKESYDVNIVGVDNLVAFAKRVSFIHKYKQEKLEQAIKDCGRFVTSVKPNGSAEVYDFTEPETHWGVVNGVVVHNSEIFLRSNGLCNLSTSVIRRDDTIDDLIKKVETATIIGTFQSTLTNFRYVRSIWKRNAEEERLLGVSFVGIMDHPVLNGSMGNNMLIQYLDTLREHAVKVNNEWSEKLGINPSVAITAVKPEGTTSQLVDASSGIHPRYSEYYVRTVRSDKLDPIGKFIKDQGVRCEDDVMKPEKTWVFSFPIASPEGSKVASNMTAIDQLEHYLIWYRHWPEHTVSITVYVREHEWMDVGAWVYKHFDEVGGVSFLPYSDHSYQQAPYQPISRTEYDDFVAVTPKINWDEFKVEEHEDKTEGAQQYSCSAGVCELI